MHISISTLAVSLLQIAQAFVIPGIEQIVIEDDYSSSSTIRDVLLANRVIGDVLDDFEPTYYIDVAYPKYHEIVLLGNDIPVKAVAERPAFTFHSMNAQTEFDGGADPDTVFTLILTDPDALSRQDPSKSEMCHWILTNLTSPVPVDEIDKHKKHKKHKGHKKHPKKPKHPKEPKKPKEPKEPKKLEGELEGYQPPGPPPKTGRHRYIFVLLQGNSTDVEPPKERPHWGYGEIRHGVRDWAADNNLTVVGANFFFAANKKQ